MAGAEPATTRDWLARLVAFDTSSGRSNLDLISHVREYLAGFDVPVELISNSDGSRANLLAVVGPAHAGGVVLSGHSDVVPVTGQSWTTDPWRLHESDGRLYGRGTCDMKGFCASALAAVPEFLAAGLGRPLILALSYDEEIGCVGAPSMIRRMKEALPPPAAVIVGEPTSMQVVGGHKGCITFRTTVEGVPGHSSDPENGASAVEIAAVLILWLLTRRGHCRARADLSSPFRPPYSSITANVIEGGLQPNVMAPSCTFRWDARLLPGEDPDALQEDFARRSGDLMASYRASGLNIRIETERVTSVPAFMAQSGGVAVTLAKTLSGERDSSVVGFASEAGQFEEAGFPSVICGPGSIEQAHKADEYVSIEQLERCDSFVRDLMAFLR